MALNRKVALGLALAAFVLVAVASVAGRGGAPRPAEAERQGARAGDPIIPDHYVVLFRGTVDSPSDETKARERRHGFRAKFVYRRAVKGFAAKLSARQVERLEADPDVASVTHDRRVRAVADLASGEPTPPPGIRRIGAATTATTRAASGARVAVIDTGVDLDHADLNATSGTNCVTPGSPADDDHGHGTHVAGTIAAENDGSGLTGVAPGSKVVAAKVLDGRGSGTASQVICGIDWATATRTDSDPANDVVVANMSLGGPGAPVESCASTTDPEHKAICTSTAAGITYVVAAGNDGWDFDYAPQPDTPAAYPEALTVSAMADSDGAPGAKGTAPVCRAGEGDDRYASFSNFAATASGEAHTVAAPGVCIRSTAPGGAYATMSGTSMASPHVAGAVALCLDEGGTRGPCAGLSPRQIVEKMRIDAQSRATSEPSYGFVGDPDSPVAGKYFGNLVWGGTAAADTAPPTVSSVSPANGHTAVARTASVSVAFSEPMDKAAAEAAFSLARTSNDERVAGSFTWSGNTMTFRPSTSLEQATDYTARVGTGAKDAAGNTLAAEKAWSFRTLATVTAAPSATVIDAGSVRAGSYARLDANDDLLYDVNSTSSGTRTASWYGRFTGIANSLRSLKVTYRGKASTSCTQTVSLWRWTTSSWVSLDSRSLGTTEVQVDRSPTGTLADYVSGTSGDGEVRARVRCTRNSSSFYSRADLLRLTYERP